MNIFSSCSASSSTSSSTFSMVEDVAVVVVVVVVVVAFSSVNSDIITLFFLFFFLSFLLVVFCFQIVNHLTSKTKLKKNIVKEEEEDGRFSCHLQKPPQINRISPLLCFVLFNIPCFNTKQHHVTNFSSFFLTSIIFALLYVPAG